MNEAWYIDTCNKHVHIHSFKSKLDTFKNPDMIQYAYNTMTELYKHKWNDLAHSLFKTWFNMCPIWMLKAIFNGVS